MNISTKITSVVLEINNESSQKIRLVKEFFGVRTELFIICNTLQSKYSPEITKRFFIHTLHNGDNVGAYEFFSGSNVSHVAICCSLDQIFTSLILQNL